MAFVMLSFVGIAEKRPGFFAVMIAIAGSIHMPALIFLPAYGLTRMKVSAKAIVMYIILGIMIFVFKNQFIAFIRSFYYDDDTLFVYSGEIGSRVIMILGFTLFGLCFRGFRNPVMGCLFHIMATAAILQMLSGYDHIFTRMTDYYFQLSVLYLPLTFFHREDTREDRLGLRPILPFNRRSMMLITAVVAVFLLWFYWTYAINVVISNEVDNYLNYRTMWDVIQ